MVQPNCQNSTKQWHFKKHIMTLTLWITIVLRHFLKLSLWNFTNPVLTTWQNVSELVIEFIEVVHGFTFQLLWNGRLSLEALKDTIPVYEGVYYNDILMYNIVIYRVLYIFVICKNNQNMLYDVICIYVYISIPPQKKRINYHACIGFFIRVYPAETWPPELLWTSSGALFLSRWAASQSQIRW